MINESLFALSETMLSAYPLLIKLTDTSVYFQTGLRMAIYTTLAACMALLTGSPILGTHILSKETLLVGIMNLLHVGTSYTAFDTLAAGNAMAFFYTYPVWNLLGAYAILKERISIQSLPWILVALIGALLLAQPSKYNWTMFGVVCALMAALTETGIYLWFRSRSDTDQSDQPWTKMIQMYGSSGLFWIIGTGILALLGLLASNIFSISSSGLASILLFNTLIGFVGYALRFYLIPKVSTVLFSALSFIGIVSAYVLGWLFTDEMPTIVQGLGAVAIIVANTVLVNKETL